MAFGPLQSINAPAPGNEPGLLGFLSGLVGGLHQYNQQREQEKQKKQEFQTQQAESKQKQELTGLDIQQRQSQIQAQHVQAAQQQQQNALARVFQDPRMAADPIIIKAVTQANELQGLPTPMTKDGKLDISPYKKTIDSLDPKVLQNIQSMDPLHRKPILDALERNGFDVPKELRTNTAFIDAKTEATIERNKMLGAHWIHEDTIRSASERWREKHQANQDATAAARQQSQDMVNQARIQALATTSAASLMRAQTGVKEYELRLQKFHANPTGGRTPLQASLGQILKLHDKLNSDLVKAQTSYNMMMNGDDPPDPSSEQAQQAMQNITDLQSQIEVMGNQYSQAVTALQSGADISARLSASSGMKVTPVQKSQVGGEVIGNAPPGASDGFYPNSKFGPVTVRQGKLYKGKV